MITHNFVHSGFFSKCQLLLGHHVFKTCWLVFPLFLFISPFFSPPATFLTDSFNHTVQISCTNLPRSPIHVKYFLHSILCKLFSTLVFVLVGSIPYCRSIHTTVFIKVLFIALASLESPTWYESQIFHKQPLPELIRHQNSCYASSNCSASGISSSSLLECTRRYPFEVFFSIFRQVQSTGLQFFVSPFSSLFTWYKCTHHWTKHLIRSFSETCIYPVTRSMTPHIIGITMLAAR